MTKIQSHADSVIDSTDTHESAEGFRDETIDEEYQKNRAANYFKIGHYLIIFQDKRRLHV